MGIRPAAQLTRQGVAQTCSACFAQDKDKRYVDFDAACDRGFVPTYGDGVAESVVMDDLIVCDECVTRAAEAVGMTNDAALKDELVETQRKLEAAEREAERQAEYASRLEGVFDSRPQPIKIPHRKRIRNRDEEG